MNIKEAYRYLKFLDNNIGSLESYVLSSANAVRTVVKSFKSKVNKEAEDTVEDITPVRAYEASVIDIAFLVANMIDEKAKLARIVEKTKSDILLDWKVSGVALSIDTGIEYAKKTRDLAKFMEPLLKIAPTVTKGSGFDFKFNVEGNQMKYLFDTEVTKSVDFNKRTAVEKYQKLMDTADRISSLVEEAQMRNVEGFLPTYSIYDTLDSIVNDYVATTKHP